jgi:hypothetical protein
MTAQQMGQMRPQQRMSRIVRAVVPEEGRLQLAVGYLGGINEAAGVSSCPMNTRVSVVG